MNAALYPKTTAMVCFVADGHGRKKKMERESERVKFYRTKCRSRGVEEGALI